MITEKNRFFVQHINKSKVVLQTAEGILKYYYSQQDKMGIEKAQESALKVLRQMRYEDGNYIWVNTLEYRFLMHPLLETVEGQDMSQLIDPDGIKPIIVATDTALAGGGTFKYSWPKPGYPADKFFPKISYVFLFKPWKWVIGTGSYVDYIESSFINYILYRFFFTLCCIIIVILISIISIRKITIK
ncbi:cache domain-containing protein [Zooshikella harenae]|uniref:Cache domain-containing protein n=1 Tax=Zooshikella harenae TaxID=2827238 RepID=A0ABS5ZCQ6_9GAMM|nr:cache domain-containing protein [Zooshikella harenae]MBU2711779.1 cache domain-containing protein [Zooshikella harenae]